MQQTWGRVPRVGLAHHGRLLEERVLAPRTAVTIGRHPSCTLVLPQGCPVNRHALLVHRQGAWHLVFDERMTGRIGVDGQSITLEELAEAGRVERRANRCQLRLADRHRGRITVGDCVVLFQFVEPAPQPARVPSGFRPRLFDRDDPVFLGLLALNTVAAAVLQIWIQNQVVVPTLVDVTPWLPDPVAIYIQQPVDLPEAPPPPPVQVAREVVEADAPTPDTPSDDAAEVREARRAEAVAAEVAESPLLAALQETVALITRGDPDHDLRVALDSIDASEAVAAATLSLHRGVGIGTDNATISELGRAGMGPSRLDTAEPDVNVETDGRRSITTESPRHAGRVESAFRALGPCVRICYERVLKLRPDAEGRVELFATISDGVLIEAHVRSDLHDLDFEACVERAIYDLEPPAGASAEVMYPFVVTR